MNPFICGKYVCGTEVRTLYSLNADKEERQHFGHGPYHASKYFRDVHGHWQVLDFSQSPRRPIPVTDTRLIGWLDEASE